MHTIIVCTSKKFNEEINEKQQKKETKEMLTFWCDIQTIVKSSN